MDNAYAPDAQDGPRRAAGDWPSARASTASSGPWRNLGYQLPTGRTVINLAPADLRKDAGAFDLPIALGLLVATRQLRPEAARRLRHRRRTGPGRQRCGPVKGALSMAMAARDRGFTRLIVPAENAREAAVVEEVEVFGVGIAERRGRPVVGPAGAGPGGERDG